VLSSAWGAASGAEIAALVELDPFPDAPNAGAAERGLAHITPRHYRGREIQGQGGQREA
jgi:hypothetical protein